MKGFSYKHGVSWVQYQDAIDKRSLKRAGDPEANVRLILTFINGLPQTRILEMPQPTAEIRLYKATDEKLARFMIGKASMESLAVANRRGEYFPSFLVPVVIQS